MRGAKRKKGDKMMKAVLTIEDVGDKVKINVDFGKKGADKTSYAHYLALLAAKKISEEVNGEEENKN